MNMNTTFTCTGSIHVEGWGKPINCSKRAGHGTQTLKVATGNSCNPAFVTMGLKIGTEAYYRYLKSFGLMETTGIDLPAEAEGIFANEDSFNSNVVSLAAYSFGQTFNVTPLELIRAQAATINGGYLYTPYLVEQVLDDEGNILSQHETTAVRQVISEETSAKVRECLEWVVSDGGAIVPGNASIILYLGQEKPDTPCTVPNVVGKSASEANKAITNAGLIMKVTGTTTASSGNVYAITQSLPAGTEVAAGTVVTVQFGDNSVLD